LAARPIGDSYGGYRSRLVEQLRVQGIRDLSVLRAFGEVPRHLFIPTALRHQAYEDIALPIGNGQTVSQPTTQARFLEALELTGTERVLEVGTGSGYQTALLSLLVSLVVSVERVPSLAQSAKQALESAGVLGVTVVVGDGSLGWLPQAPYDAIVVAAAGPVVPEPLVHQLAENGKLVLPLNLGGHQEVWRVLRRNGTIVKERLGEAHFVPLIGKHGFERPSEPA